MLLLGAEPLELAADFASVGLPSPFGEVEACASVECSGTGGMLDLLFLLAACLRRRDRRDCERER